MSIENIEKNDDNNNINNNMILNTDLNHELKESETSFLNLKANLKADETIYETNKNFLYKHLIKDKEEYGELAYDSSNENEYKDFTNNNLDNKTFLNSNHNLNSKWCFWYISRKEKDHKIPYSERLKKIAEFASLEEFFKYYMFIKSPSDMERNTDVSLFKESFKPLWESCPESGIWFIRFKKNDDPIEIDLRWEKIIFALIGEHFLDTSIIGAVLSIRGRETIIELWFNYQSNEIRKNYIGQKMKEIIGLENSVILYFKDNLKAIKDKSTIKNAETYNLKFDNRKNTYY